MTLTRWRWFYGCVYVSQSWQQAFVRSVRWTAGQCVVSVWSLHGQCMVDGAGGQPVRTDVGFLPLSLGGSSSTSSSGTAAGGASCPWMIQMHGGQRVNLTFINFNQQVYRLRLYTTAVEDMKDEMVLVIGRQRVNQIFFEYSAFIGLQLLAVMFRFS